MGVSVTDATHAAKDRTSSGTVSLGQVNLDHAGILTRAPRHVPEVSRRSGMADALISA
jgi:hypothetical protein